MTTVVALGGNALNRRGEAFDVATQRRNARVAAEGVALIGQGDSVVLTHGNGPQVGFLALQNELLGPDERVPFDVLDAESEGMIGYLLEQELGRVHRADNIATLLAQVVVDPADPAFQRPTKPVGPVFDVRHGAELAARYGWSMATDENGVRRVVPSPEPVDVIELNAIRLLLGAGVLVITAGGGGIPVAALPNGGHVGVEAVIDKDLTAALLARKLGAHRLILLTDVDAVYDKWGTRAPVAIRRGGVVQFRRMQFAPGSMGPKIEAACRFASRGGRAYIGSLDDVPGLLAGQSGSEVVGGDVPVELHGGRLAS